MEKLITVATFDSPSEAEVGKLFLEENGIRAILADSNLVGMNRFLSNAVGGVKLQVAASDADQASEILEQYQASRMNPQEDLSEEPITFACQECGKSITFPGERGGHVEICPDCGSYVDVPHKTETPSLAASNAAAPPSAGSKAKQQIILDPNARTTAQLWIEVSAVLCLAYLPWLLGGLDSTEADKPVDLSLVNEVLYRIIAAARISMPLLVIIALAKDRWSSFGIVRPKWAADIVIGCFIWICARLFGDFVASVLPLSLLRTSYHPHLAARAAAEGILGYVLPLIAIAVSASVEELVFRGYLIPRFERLLRSTWLAVLISTAMFGACHLYQGTALAIVVAADGFVYAIAFCLLRRLWPLCVAHALGNIVVYFHVIR
jgi:membrane protease YdiL (CAAX protease family)